MKLRRLVSLCLMFTLIVSALILDAEAHQTAREHDSDLERILFGTGFSKYKSEKVKIKVESLESASYLTIDQFGGKGRDTFSNLKENKMIPLTLKFDDINYSVLPGSKINTSATNHRKFTHQGWERDYSASSKEAAKFWNTRRKILLSTVNSIFGFDKVALFGYSEKTESMAGIIYYAHILGDFYEADNSKKINLLPDLAGTHSTDQDKNYDVVTSLQKYVEILFGEQKNSYEYKQLIRGLEEVQKKAGKLVQSAGGVNTDEEFAEYHGYAEEILELLQNHLPILLKNEDFFAKQFFPE
ncbi:MAG: hypothetical protein KBS46_01500 [Clostridiales bacterium]|nr:hypothetical protein [Candidatus Apopatocola equi]